MPVNFSLGYTILRGVLVERIGAGIILGRIDLDGGRTSAWLVETADGPRAVRREDVRVVA